MGLGVVWTVVCEPSLDSASQVSLRLLEIQKFRHCVLMSSVVFHNHSLCEENETLPQPVLRASVGCSPGEAGSVVSDVQAQGGLARVEGEVEGAWVEARSNRSCRHRPLDVSFFSGASHRRESANDYASFS